MAAVSGRCGGPSLRVALFVLAQSCPLAGATRFDLRDAASVDQLLIDLRPDVVVHLACGLLPRSGAVDYLKSRRRWWFRRSGSRIDSPRWAAQWSFCHQAVRCTAPRSRTCCRSKRHARQSASAVSRSSRLRATSGSRDGLRYLIVRPANPYGPHQDTRSGQGLVTVLTEKALRSETVEVWGDGTVVRDYIYVEDLCASIAHLVTKGFRDATVNIGTGHGSSVMDVVRAVEHETGVPLKLRFEEARRVDSARAVLDVSRLRATGSPMPRLLSVGLADYVRRLKKI